MTLNDKPTPLSNVAFSLRDEKASIINENLSFHDKRHELRDKALSLSNAQVYNK
ncbi:MAG: hypothetical protein ABR968_01915 [Bacteroidales bacterium]